MMFVNETESEKPRCQKCEHVDDCDWLSVLSILFKSVAGFFMRKEIGRFAEICSRYEEKLIKNEKVKRDHDDEELDEKPFMGGKPFHSWNPS